MVGRRSMMVDFLIPRPCSVTCQWAPEKGLSRSGGKMLLRGPSSKKVLVSRALVRTDEFCCLLWLPGCFTKCEVMPWCGVHVEVRRWLLEASPLIPQCGLLQVSNSAHRVWQQLPLSSEPYCLLGTDFLVSVLEFPYWSAEGHGLTSGRLWLSWLPFLITSRWR